MSTQPSNCSAQNGITSGDHVDEVDELLDEVNQVVGGAPIGYNVEVEKSRPYQNDKDWELQTGMIRGYAPLAKEEQLSDPEMFALGAQMLEEQEGEDVSTAAEINIDGIGGTVTAEYELKVNYEEASGVQYGLEKVDNNAADLENQEFVQEDLEYIEGQMEETIKKYNKPDQGEAITPEWNYGQERVQALDD